MTPRCFAALAVLVLFGCRAPPRTPDVQRTPTVEPIAQSGGDKLELWICRDGSVENASRWAKNIAAMITEVAAASDPKLAWVGVKYGICNAGAPVCYSEPGIIYCREAVLARVFESAAFLALVATGVIDPPAEFMNATMLVPEADRIAALKDPPELSRLFDRVAAAEFEDANAVDPGLYDAMILYQGISRFTAGFVISHELYHARGNRCNTEQPATVESDGLLNELEKNQLRGTLLCAATIEMTEFQADRCALRTINELRIEHEQLFEQAPRMGRLVQEAAADLLAWGAASSWHPNQPPGGFQYVIIDNYIQTPYRILLAASEVLGPGQRVCNKAASLFVQTAQAHFTSCPGDGEMSDLLLAHLALGVEESYNTGVWTEQSFSCAPRQR